MVPTTDRVKPFVNTKGEEVKPDEESPVSLYFKSAMEPHIGQVDYFKVVTVPERVPT